MSEKRKILIVDDDKEMVAVMNRILVHDDHSYQLDVAYNGKEALSKLDEFFPDLVLLDVRMPEMDGFAFCEQMKASEKHQNVKVIVVSGALDMDSVDKFMKLGANDYLTKPFRNEFLLMLVERVLSS